MVSTPVDSGGRIEYMLSWEGGGDGTNYRHNRCINDKIFPSGIDVVDYSLTFEAEARLNNS
jgi:hypothetical protein